MERTGIFVVRSGRGRRSGLAAMAFALFISVMATLGGVALAADRTVCALGCEFTSIQAAIDGSSAGDTLLIGSEVFVENVVVTKDLTLIGAGAGSTVINGGAAATVVRVGPGITALISDLQITNGLALDGGGVFNEGTLTLERVVVSGNAATDLASVADGGGIANEGSLTVLDSLVADNVADRGGGIWNVAGQLAVTDSTISSNVARNHGGGGIASALSTSAVTVTGSTIEGNTVIAPGTDQRGGGGIWANQSDLTVEDSTIRNNDSGYSAGGIYVSGSAATFLMRRSTVAGNSTGTDPNRGVGRGAGVSVRSSSRSTIEDSTISGNIAASSGGGIDVRAPIVIANSTISGNSSDGTGGGVVVDSAASFDSVTIAFNVADRGGGIGSFSNTAVVENTIIARNEARIAGNNCAGNLFTSTVVMLTSNDCTTSGTGNVVIDNPLIDGLAANGGPTFTHALLDGSPAIDTGTTDLTVDQRGEPRPGGADDDIGAFEVQPIAPPTDADVAIVVNPSIVNVDAGASAQLDLVVTNAGPADATNVIVDAVFAGAVDADVLPPECGFDPAATRLLCALPFLAAGSGDVLSPVMRFPSGGLQILTVTLAADEPDPDPSNNVQLVPIDVIGAFGANLIADVALVAGANDFGQVLTGTEVTVNVAVSNAGPNPASDVTAIVEVPGVVIGPNRITDWTITQWDPLCRPPTPGGVLTCELPDLPAPFDPRFPTTRLVSFSAIANSPGDVVVTASGAEPDPAPQNNTASTSIDVRSFSADLSISETSSTIDDYLLDGTADGTIRYAATDGLSEGQVEPTLRFRISPADQVTAAEVTSFSGTCVEERIADFLQLTCPSDYRNSSWATNPRLRFTVDTAGKYTVQASINGPAAFDTDTSNNAVETLLTVLPPPPIEVRAIEVTQAVQDWQNSVDLFEGKGTVVRVFLQDPAALGMRVGGRLAGLRNGQPLAGGPLVPVRDTIFVQPDATGNRDALGGSLNFLVPEAWTAAGDLEFVFGLFDAARRPADCVEPDGAPDCRVTVSFTSGDEPEVDITGIPYWTDEVQWVILTPTGDPAPGGTFTLTVDGETTGSIAADAAAADVAAAVASVSTIGSDEVVVEALTEDDIAEDEVGWRISIRQRRNVPAIGVNGSNLTGATAAMSNRLDGGSYREPTLADLIEQIRRLETSMPTANVRTRIYYLQGYDFKPSLGDTVNPDLKAARLMQLSTCPTCTSDALRVAAHLLGGGGGLSSGTVYSLYTSSTENPNDTGYARNRGPHEFAHSYGKAHAVVEDNGDDGTIGLCGAVASSDAIEHPFVEEITGFVNNGLDLDGYSDITWPAIGPLDEGTDAEIWGFDIRYLGGDVNDLAVVDPREAAALMAYCNTGIGQTRWPSSFAYAAVADGIANAGSTLSGTRDQMGDVVIVSGTVDGDGAVSLRPVTGTTGRIPGQEAGDLEVRFVNDAGIVLSSIVTALDNGDGRPDVPTGSADVPTVPASFAAVLPAPGPELAQLVVSRGEAELARITASAHDPVVSILEPSTATVVGSEGLTIEWSASDPDGDALSSTVLYSADDGERWTALGIGIEGSTLWVPGDRLASSDVAKVKVIASDGLRFAEATSEVFHVGNSAPVVEIVTPGPDQAPAASGDQVILGAFAWDTEDGVLPGEAAVWASDLDGDVGIGSPLILDGATLSVGCHRITVGFIDSAGALGTATTTLAIATECDESDRLGSITIRKAAPDAGGVNFSFSSDIAGANAFVLGDGDSFTAELPAGSYTVTEAETMAFELRSVQCADPSGGSSGSVSGRTASIDLDPGETIECVFTNVPINIAPTVTVDPSSREIQVTDEVAPITVSVIDPDSAPSEVTLEAIGLPGDLTLGTLDCIVDGGGVSCGATISGTATAAPGSYEVTLTGGDGLATGTAVLTIEVVAEDASIRFHGGNPAAVRTSGGTGGPFDIMVRVTESEPDMAAGLPLPGNLADADVAIVLQPLGPGGTVGPVGPCAQRIDGSGYDQEITVVCTFDDVPVDAYSVNATVNGDVYAGYAEDVVVVYDPANGFAQGGGTFIWPGTTDDVRFGFSMEYNKKGTNVKGGLMLVRTTGDGSQYVIKSNALYGLALGDSHDPVRWASFSGKTTYDAPELDEPDGNHDFLAYVEDADPDRFWIEIRDKAGQVIDTISMSRPGSAHAVAITGGDVTVPHGARNGPR